jgi:hypothetical protein
MDAFKVSNDLIFKNKYSMSFKIWIQKEKYDVDLYARWGDISNYNYDLYYQIGAGSSVYWGTITSMFCANLNTVTVPSHDILYVYAVNASNANQVYIQGSDTTCPSNSASTCVYSRSIESVGVAAITVYVDSFGEPQYCT